MTTTTQYPPGAVERVLSALAMLPVERRAAWLVQCTRTAGGAYTHPGASSHLHEVSLFGIHARGEDEEALLRNWIVVAQNTLRSEVRVLDMTSDGERRVTQTLIERASALQVIARPDLFTDEQVVNACTVVISGHAQALDYLRARALLQFLTRPTPQAPESPHD